MKVILNKCYGGFGVSDEAYKLYAKKAGISLFSYIKRWDDKGKPIYEKVKDENLKNSFFVDYFTEDFGDSPQCDCLDWDKALYLSQGYRDDQILVEVVEQLGQKANGDFAELVVVEIPDGMDYVIDEYDGIETLHQKVQEW